MLYLFSFLKASLHSALLSLKVMFSYVAEAVMKVSISGTLG